MEEKNRREGITHLNGLVFLSVEGTHDARNWSHNVHRDLN